MKILDPVCGMLLVWGFWVAATGTAIAQEQLQDEGFELSETQGSFPDSGFWTAEHLGEAGAVCTSTASRTGSRGLWVYTGEPSGDWWSGPYQAVAAEPGVSYEASAWIRAAVGEPWVEGSRALVHVSFHDDGFNVLSSAESEAHVEADAVWQYYTVTTGAAPAEAVWVRLACLVEKPKGSDGQTVVNFDDCSLSKVLAPAVRVSTRALGIPASATAGILDVHNPGSGDLVWEVLDASAWLSANPSSGLVKAGDAVAVQIGVSREAVSGTGTVRGEIRLATDAGDVEVDVYVEMAQPAPPQLPSIVKTSGRQLVVRDRLPDGTLSPPYHYVIRGAAWSPASMETVDDPVLRRPEFRKWYVADIQLMRAMNANTVYTFMDFGTDEEGMAVLDALYRNGMKAVITVDENGSANTNRIDAVVPVYREHPAVLAWAIGNEWNINLYHTVPPGSAVSSEALLAAAELTERMAQQVKGLDSDHPVISIFGDIDVSDGPLAMTNIVNRYCPSVDAWGLNVYRGRSLGPLFTDWARLATVPVYLSEFGTDAFRTRVFRFEEGRQSVDGSVDESMQAAFVGGLWREVADHLSAVRLDGVCLGGTVFEWNDEWWKASPAFGGVVGHQDYIGFFTYWNVDAMPDSVANEEWFGVVSIDRRPREIYDVLREEFGSVAVPVDLNNPQAPLRFLGVEAVAGGIQLEWTGGIQATQWLERATSLSSGIEWERILTIPPPVEITNRVVDSMVSGTVPVYYRVGSSR